MKSLLRLLLRLQGTGRHELVLTILVSILLAFSELVFILTIAISVGFLTGSTLSTNISNLFSADIQRVLNNPPSFLIILSFVIFLITLARTYFLRLLCTLSAGISDQIALYAFRAYLTQSYESHVRAEASDRINDLTISIRDTTDGITDFVNGAGYVISILSISVLLLVTSPQLSLCSIGLMVPFYIGFNRDSRRRISLLGQTILTSNKGQLRLISYAFKSLHAIYISGSFRSLQSSFLNNAKALNRSKNLVRFYALLPRFLLEPLILFLGISILYLSSSLSLTLDQSHIVIFVVSSLKLLPYFQASYIAYSNIKSYERAVRDVFRLISDHSLSQHFLSRSQGAKDPFVYLYSDRLFPKDYLSAARPSNDRVTALVLSDLNFAHSDSQASLNTPVSISLHQGDRLLITGPSGCGKSSILDLIAGLQTPFNGNVVYSTEKGQYLSTPTFNSDLLKINSLVSYVTQESAFFGGSILENLAMNNSFDMSKVEYYIQMVCLDKVISELPRGVDSDIGEDGMLLSCGQRQRLSIAKSLLLDRHVIILDEATSGLDELTEHSVLQNIANIYRDRIMIAVSHNPRIRGLFNKYLYVS